MLLISASREHQKREVWSKGHAVPGADPALWRKDDHGFVMSYADHGNYQSPYGWVMHHVVPKTRGGTDALFNLQPVNIGRNRDSQDPQPWGRAAPGRR